jgi:NADH:ubiquinone oxidoreductase subunit 2 (subunit N)
MGRVNQLCSKKLLAYSSIFRAAWIVRCGGEFESLIQYLIAYTLAVSVVALYLAILGNVHLNELIVQTTKKRLAIFLVGLLRLGGSPPFLGFYAKILVLHVLINSCQGLILIVLVVSSVFLLYVYMRFFYYIITNANLELQAPSPELFYNRARRLGVFFLLALPII